jgi:hypothetical protein
MDTPSVGMRERMVSDTCIYLIIRRKKKRKDE